MVAYQASLLEESHARSVLKLHGQNCWTPFLECLVSHAGPKRALTSVRESTKSEEEAGVHPQALLAPAGPVGDLGPSGSIRTGSFLSRSKDSAVYED